MFATFIVLCSFDKSFMRGSSCYFMLLSAMKGGDRDCFFSKMINKDITVNGSHVSAKDSVFPTCIMFLPQKILVTSETFRVALVMVKNRSLMGFPILTSFTPSLGLSCLPPQDEL